MKNISIPVRIKRYLAFLIDAIIIYFVVYSISNLIILLAFPFHNSVLNIIIDIVEMLLIIGLIIYNDTELPNGSIGKRIVGIGVYVDNTNEFASNELKAKRVKEHIRIAFHYGNTKIDKTNKNDVDIICNTRVDNIKKN